MFQLVLTKELFLF